MQYLHFVEPVAAARGEKKAEMLVKFKWRALWVCKSVWVDIHKVDAGQ